MQSVSTKANYEAKAQFLPLWSVCTHVKARQLNVRELLAQVEATRGGSPVQIVQNASLITAGIFGVTNKCGTSFT